MLNKEVCQTCAKILNKTIDDNQWRTGKFLCYGLPHGRSPREVFTAYPPPEWCKYDVEHAVSEKPCNLPDIQEEIWNF